LRLGRSPGSSVGHDRRALTRWGGRRLRRRIALGRRGFVYADDKIADVDLVRVLDHQRTGDLATIDVRAIRALEVDNDELAVFEHDARMALRHVALRQHDVVSLHAANGDLGLVEHHAALLAAFFLDEYGEHWLLRPPGKATLRNGTKPR